MSEPLAPSPDVKDWTWVLERACPECGFDPSTVTGAEVADRTRSAMATMRAALQTPGAAQRHAPEVWSTVEYACHVRDVCRVFGARLSTMRGFEDPLFANWDQNETALVERYWEQDAVVVSAELAEEAERIAAAFSSVAPDEWSRPGRRSNGSVFTVDTLGRYFLHDLVHHVHDVSSHSQRSVLPTETRGMTKGVGPIGPTPFA